MHRNISDQKKNIKILMFGLVVIVLIVAMMCVTYVGILKKNMEEETKGYLSEISRQVSSMINYKISVNFDMMRSIAETYQQTPKEERAELLQEKAGQYGYVEMGAADKKGIVTTSNGTRLNMSDCQFMLDALAGKRSVSGMVSFPEDGRQGIIFVVPVMNKGEVEGAVTAEWSKTKLEDVLGNQSFGGEGYSLIIDDGGSYVLGSSNKNAVKGVTNFYQYMDSHGKLQNGRTLAEIEKDIRSDRSGMAYYSLEDGEDKAVNYVSLDVKGWHLLSIVPVSAAGAQIQQLIKLSVIINVVIIVLFISLIILIFTLQNKNYRQLMHMAYVDPVTGGMNAARFQQAVAMQLGQAAAGEYCMVCLDIQKFKLINDSFGSQAGNRALKYVYTSLQKHLEKGEYVARVMADNFDILMKTKGHEEIQDRLSRIIEKINTYEIEEGTKYLLSFRIGVYTIWDTQIGTIAIQDRATVARKKAQTQGQLGICTFYEDSDRIQMIREKEIDNRMEEALSNREFTLYLQPKVDLKTNRIAGAEALVRWEDPQYGLIFPDSFIPLFEKNGFVLKLDLYIFEEACRILRGWLDEGRKPVPIAVNLSKAHLMITDFLDNFKKISEKYDIPPELLELELTETMATDNLEVLIRIIDEIHAIGYTCALDDFGNGYSSLNILQDLPVDVLKLDKAFFNTNEDNKDRAKTVVESCIAMAGRLNMHCVAEGIEIKEQVQFLKKVKCDMLQGYILSRPLPVADFENMVYGGEDGREIRTFPLL